MRLVNFVLEKVIMKFAGFIINSRYYNVRQSRIRCWYSSIECPAISDIHTCLCIENACEVFDFFSNINAVGLIFLI